MKFGVITFPGSNSDEDAFLAISDVLGQECVRLWHKDHDLRRRASRISMRPVRSCGFPSRTATAATPPTTRRSTGSSRMGRSFSDT